MPNANPVTTCRRFNPDTRQWEVMPEKEWWQMSGLGDIWVTLDNVSCCTMEIDPSEFVAPRRHRNV